MMINKLDENILKVEALINTIFSSIKFAQNTDTIQTGILKENDIMFGSNIFENRENQEMQDLVMTEYREKT